MNQVAAGERGENSDHDDSGIDFPGPSVGIGQAGAQLLGELVENPSGQPVRDDVHFQVELPELGLEIPACDTLEHLGIHHARHTVGAREIQLDLESHEIPGPVETLLLQQPRQPVQTLPELVPVALTVGEVEPHGHDLLTHSSVPPQAGSPAAPAASSRSMMPRRSDP